MTSLEHIVKLIAEGEKDPDDITQEFWSDLHKYVERLEEEAEEVKSINHEDDREVQEETPIEFNFGGVQEEFDTIKELVKTLMENKEQARNDFQFIEWYIKTQVQNLDQNTLEGYKKGIKNSTIQRARREAVNEHPDLEPDEEVRREKEKKQEKVRQRYSPTEDEKGVSKVNQNAR